MTDSEQPQPAIDTTNEFLLSARSAHPGLGMGAYITPQLLPKFSTRQQAYRFAAWCALMAEALPEEPGQHSFEDIARAIANT